MNIQLFIELKIVNIDININFDNKINIYQMLKLQKI
jgi:hypothetical protein